MIKELCIETKRNDTRERERKKKVLNDFDGESRPAVQHTHSRTPRRDEFTLAEFPEPPRRAALEKFRFFVFLVLIFLFCSHCDHSF